VIYLQPDEKLGWKHVPGLHWTWAGRHWWAVDYSVSIRSNSQGFRDRERTFEKPEGVVRLALLGDSLIEAAQVPFEQTAGALLEEHLNAAGRRPAEAESRYEVLNFGIGNYGIGQYLLAWEEHASRYAPDLVFALVAGFHMNRTVRRYETSKFVNAGGAQLWVRPTFQLEGDRLVRVPARDYEEFVRFQEVLVRNEFDGKRMRKKPLGFGSVNARIWSPLGVWAREVPLPPRTGGPRGPEVVRVNLRILQELGEAVHRAGAQFAILDISTYWSPRAVRIERRLERLCKSHGIGYVSVSKTLLDANREGRSTRWSHDAHFNVTGNEILADAMADWIGSRRGL
jgi:lysophospholipase L1-like esterase